jgi:DNA repair exonuclease SbcCD nuclease subunit
MLKILHTADWHLGHVSKLFSDEESKKLAKARLSVIERILNLARSSNVNAILCAGDLFDSTSPADSWWRGLNSVFSRFREWQIPVVLLPGNHDPLTERSIYWPGHEFRNCLPSWVHVVDRIDFELAIGENALIIARPCTSTAGDTDLALALPDRLPGDNRIRIGLVHGSTFDMPGHRANFPIARNAAAIRGLDYLAIGDTHAFRDVTPDSVPTVYPGTPEQTNFGEIDTGYVAVVLFSNTGVRPRIERKKVGYWSWRDETVQDLLKMRALLDEDLSRTVLRLHLDLETSLAERQELEEHLSALQGDIATVGRAGAVILDRSKLRVEVLASAFPDDLPETVNETIEALRALAATEPRAKRALAALYTLARDLQ